MPAKSLVPASLMLSLLLVFVVLADGPERRLVPLPLQESGDPRLTLTEVPEKELPARLQPIRDLLQQRDFALAELQARYSQAASNVEALRIQREMHDLKRGTETALLRVQLEFAREEGQSEKIDELERILERIDAREGLLGPVARPRPVSDARGQR